jgi:general stress protein 26
VNRKAHLYDLTKGFKTAMLVTLSEDGNLRARPMAVAEIKPDADMCFSTSLDSPKIGEIEANPNVLVTFQSSSEFATIEGTAEIVRDRAEIERLWSEDWRIWFPGGTNDPHLCVLKVSAERGEYWDTGGLEGIKFMFESLKARMVGRKAERNEVQNAKVQL